MGQPESGPGGKRGNLTLMQRAKSTPPFIRSFVRSFVGSFVSAPSSGKVLCVHEICREGRGGRISRREGRAHEVAQGRYRKQRLVHSFVPTRHATPDIDDSPSAKAITEK